MAKHRVKKARALIKKYNDSWGSLRHKFNHRLINKRIVKEESNG